MKADADPILRAAATLMPAVLRIEDESKRREGDLLRLRPSYMLTLVAFRKSQGRSVYPDANSTLRVSYGKLPRHGSARWRPLHTGDDGRRHR